MALQSSKLSPIGGGSGVGAVGGGGRCNGEQGSSVGFQPAKRLALCPQSPNILNLPSPIKGLLCQSFSSHSQLNNYKMSVCNGGTGPC